MSWVERSKHFNDFNETIKTTPVVRMHKRSVKYRRARLHRAVTSSLRPGGKWRESKWSPPKSLDRVQAWSAQSTWTRSRILSSCSRLLGEWGGKQIVVASAATRTLCWRIVAKTELSVNVRLPPAVGSDWQNNFNPPPLPPPNKSLRVWPARRRPGHLYLDCCPCNPEPDKQRKMDGSMVGQLSTCSTPHKEYLCCSCSLW